MLAESVVDKSYWASLKPPLAPSEGDVRLFREFRLEGNCLLLGSTRQLIGVSDRQMDRDPWYEGPTMLHQDWRSNTEFYTNIIGDGVLNYTGELAQEVLKMCSKHCRRFIARSFNYKLPSMRIAAFFPSLEDFEIMPTRHVIFNEYSFFVWDF